MFTQVIINHQSIINHCLANYCDGIPLLDCLLAILLQGILKEFKGLIWAFDKLKFHYSLILSFNLFRSFFRKGEEEDMEEKVNPLLVWEVHGKKDSF